MLSISEVALDSFAVEFILRLSSIIFNSPFEYDVIQLHVRSGSRRACLFYVHEHERGNSCIKSPGCIHLIAFVDLVSGRIPFAVFGISGRVL